MLRALQQKQIKSAGKDAGATTATRRRKRRRGNGRRRNGGNAAAAAITGLTRCVRLSCPGGPRNLRLLVLHCARAAEGRGVHADAHAAAGVAPLETGVAKILSRPSFRLAF